MMTEIVHTRGPVEAEEMRLLTGLTYRQIDYWTTLGHLRPVASPNPGHGSRREWPLPEVIVAGVMRVLVEAGYRVEVAAKMARREGAR